MSWVHAALQVKRLRRLDVEHLAVAEYVIEQGAPVPAPHCSPGLHVCNASLPMPSDHRSDCI